MVVVLGAGIAGLAAADRLSRSGWRVRVIERHAQAGGVHRARHIGPYTYDVGSIFYEQDARIFRLAPGLSELCPQVTRVQRRIAPDGTVRHYPFEPREFLSRSPLRLAWFVTDLAWSRLAVRRDGTLDAISRKRLGRSFFEKTGLSSYIARFHHVSPRGIDESFFFHRMAFIERFTRPGELARQAMRSMRPSAPARPRPPLHVRPRSGFEPVFDRIVGRLASEGVDFRFGEELLSLKREGSLFLVQTTAGTFPAEAVVSAIPLDTLHRALFGDASGLVSLDMAMLFVSAARLDARLGNVLFNFHHMGWWKRATIYSRIYPEPRIGREFLAVEATIPQGGAYDPQAVFEDFRRHLESLGLADDLALEGHEHLDNCYPLYAPGTQVAVRQVLRRVAQAGVVTAGRQGRFEYLPTSSGVIRRVTEELDAAGLLTAAYGMAA